MALTTSSTSSQSGPSVQNIKILFAAVNDITLPLFEAGDSDYLKLTHDLEQQISKLRESLYEDNDNHQHSFLITILLPLSYDANEGKFEKPLTCALLKKFCWNVKQRCTEYKQYKDAGKTQLEAYLGHLALELADHEGLPQDTKEKSLNQTIKYFQDHISPEVNEARNKFCPSLDFKSLSDVLHEIMHGNIKVLEKEKIAIPGFSDIQVIKPDELTNEKLDTSLEEERCKVKEANQIGKQLLDTLGLRALYPSKLTMKHVMSIKSRGTWIPELNMKGQQKSSLIENREFEVKEQEQSSLRDCCQDKAKEQQNSSLNGIDDVQAEEQRKCLQTEGGAAEAEQQEKEASLKGNSAVDSEVNAEKQENIALTQDSESKVDRQEKSSTTEHSVVKDEKQDKSSRAENSNAIVEEREKRYQTGDIELTLEELPFVILQKLLMIDLRGRNSAWEKQIKVGGGHSQTASFEDETENFLAGLDDGIVGTMLPHPMDIFIATFHCCDLMLRQVLLEKMFMCHLSIPLVMAQGTSLTLNIWALRSIVVECRKKDEGMIESGLVDCSSQVVSFLRLGNTSLSKSQLLNDIINAQSHQTFFSKQNSILTTAERSASYGLVEAAWYLPSGRDDDFFENVTMFLNLRGDAIDHRQQTEFMSSMSAVVIVIIDVNNLADPETIDTVKMINTTKCKVVILMTTAGMPNIPDIRTAVQSYKEAMSKANITSPKMIASFKGKTIRTLTDITHEIRNHLKDILTVLTETGGKMSSLQLISDDARQSGFLIDEDDHFCQEGKHLADEAICHIKNKSLSEVKQELLPVQRDLWPKWSKLLKERNRTTGKKGQNTSSVEKERVQREMTQLRQKQIDMFYPPSPLMLSFFSTLCKCIHQKDIVRYYLQWLKMHFDEKSRLDLPDLRREYNKVWLQFNSEISKKNESPEELKQLKQKVKEAEQKLTEASCGLEHLFREVGQMYEATTEIKSTLDPKTQTIINQLPFVAAKLLLLGHPIEVMDGDASNVPLTWVKAVLDNVETLTKDKRVFVLSVLGIQSSGKSTLMNTMFGLRFAVSAGRCTRGINIQLVEVDKSPTDLPFDYVLIVDTEGLRAAELSQDKHEHDNELATLVIGIGDVVILNIKGANVAEMKDVLQIAAHAFLRMRMVNENINLRQTCVFIHQNVSASNAQEKMMHGRQNLLDKLDEMTKEAAELEGFSEIRAFSQVIDIDIENCVWYFSDLWGGDPPMAPANPGYSEHVTQVRNCLLYEIARGRKTFLSIAEVKLRIQDLWNGILADDFVFSFRNSLAVKAYRGLEDKYQQLTWAMEQTIMKWSLETASITLQRCETENGLDVTVNELVRELENVASKELAKQTRELELFFEQNSLKEIIIQWKAEKEHSLGYCKTELVSTTKKECLQSANYLKFEMRQRTKQQDLEHKTFEKASELADIMKGQSINEVNLKDEFDKTWENWIAELAPPSERDDISIDVIVEGILYEKFSSDIPTLSKELDKQPLHEKVDQKRLLHNFEINIKDIQGVKVLCQPLVEAGLGKYAMSTYKQRTNKIIATILQKVDSYLSDLTARDINFQQSFATCVIKIVTDAVDEHNKHAPEHDQFKLLQSFKVRLCVHMCRYANQDFTKMQNDYVKRHSAAEKLKEMKQRAFNLFQNKVMNCTVERIAADLFCDRLGKIITAQVMERMPNEVYKELIETFKKKYYLIVAILEDLAMKEDFGDYIRYIRDSKTFAHKWLTKFANTLFFKQKNTDQRCQTLYAENARLHIATTLKKIKASMKANESPGNIHQWLSQFCTEIKKHLPVREDQMQSATDQSVSDLKNFERYVFEGLDSMEAELSTVFIRQTDDIKWPGITPYQKALDKLWGCGEQCPFCKAPCEWLANHEVAHRCIQHRPKGVCGTHWTNDCTIDGLPVKSDQLSHYTCNYSVQNDGTFSCHFCKNCNDECRINHPYKKYKTWFPSWDIAPSPTNENSKYWMWFFSTYQYQLIGHYTAVKLPHIPESWKTILKEEALKSLREY